MASYDIAAGLMGGLKGGLTGYQAVLTSEANSALESQKEQALLEREKNLAKYRAKLGREEKDYDRTAQLDQVGPMAQAEIAAQSTPEAKLFQEEQNKIAVEQAKALASAKGPKRMTDKEKGDRILKIEGMVKDDLATEVDNGTIDPRDTEKVGLFLQSRRDHYDSIVGNQGGRADTPNPSPLPKKPLGRANIKIIVKNITDGNGVIADLEGKVSPEDKAAIEAEVAKEEARKNKDPYESLRVPDEPKRTGGVLDEIGGILNSFIKPKVKGYGTSDPNDYTVGQ